MKKPSISPRLALLAVALLMLPLAGCETESTSQAAIALEPQSATVQNGQSIELRASGWSDYHWTLSSAGIGYLNTPTGDTVIYTSRTGSRTTQVVTVTSDYSVLTGTNTVSEPIASTALITHVP